MNVYTNQVYILLKLQAVEGIEKQLMTTVRFRGKPMRVLGQRPHNLTLLTELHHLSCFLPGTLALGVYYGYVEVYHGYNDGVCGCTMGIMMVFFWCI